MKITECLPCSVVRIRWRPLIMITKGEMSRQCSKQYVYLDCDMCFIYLSTNMYIRRIFFYFLLISSFQLL